MPGPGGSTSAAPVGARAAQTAQRKARLISAAVDLASEGGYEAVQMRDVASRAEVALGTLYRHYSSKDQLLLAALLEQAEQLRTRIEQRQGATSKATAATRVSDALQRACRALERQPMVTAAMVRAMFSTDADAEQMKQAVLIELQAIIASAIAGAPTPAALDLEAVVDVLGHVWFATLAFWTGGVSDAYAMNDRLTRAADMLLD